MGTESVRSPWRPPGWVSPGWSPWRGPDSNRRIPGYESGVLTTYTTPLCPTSIPHNLDYAIRRQIFLLSAEHGTAKLYAPTIIQCLEASGCPLGGAPDAL